MKRYKSISLTIKDDFINEQLNNSVTTENKYSNGSVFYLKTKNVQDVIREILSETKLIDDSYRYQECGDRSNWEPGVRISIKLVEQHATQLRAAAKEQGIKVQQLIMETLKDWFLFNPVTMYTRTFN